MATLDSKGLIHTNIQVVKNGHASRVNLRLKMLTSYNNRILPAHSSF